MGTRQEARDRLERELGHYVRRQVTFGAEVTLIAQAESSPTILAAVADIQAWQRSCYIALRQALNAVDLAPDEPTWDAVAINYASLDATKPAVTQLQQLVQL